MTGVTIRWPSVIEFGKDKFVKLKDHLVDLVGQGRVFFLADPHIRENVENLSGLLEKTGFDVEISTHISPEPSFDDLEKLLAPVKKFAPDAVVGAGGGSTMDLAKLVAVLYTGEQDVEDIVGVDRIKSRKTKLITVSTTSGTGSEVTPIAIITDANQKLKKGVVSRFLLPDAAIVDPLLTMSLPSPVTAATGMDALTHCIEAYTNKYSHPITDNLALKGIQLISSNLETAVKKGDCMEARTGMALGSLYGGLSFGVVGVAAVHALAYPLGGNFHIPHGVSNAVLLPYVMNFNRPSCLEKYSNIAAVFGIPLKGSHEETAGKLIPAIRELSKNCGIPSNLRELNIPESAISSMAEAAVKIRRLMDNNPRPINEKEAERIYRQAFEAVID
jgi:alcohol dehydrogenase class IV